MKKLLSGIISIAFFAVVASTAYASDGYGCQPIYGGGQTCVTQGNILINKMIQNPQTGDFVDNLTNSTDPRFGADQNVAFQISVINTGDATISQTTVVDTLPLDLVFVSGPGTYDANSRKLTFVVANLMPNEKRVFSIMAKVSGKIASGDNCDEVNQASATADNGQNSNDISRFCVQNSTPSTTKGGLPIYPVPQKKFTTPATGPEALPLIGIFGSAITGLYLRKKSSK